MRGRRGVSRTAPRLICAATALALGVPAVAGCSGGGPAEDMRGEWAYVSGTTAAGDLRPPARELPTLVLDEDGGAGHTGCNAYGGDVEQDGQELSFGPVEQTFMGCGGAVGAFESDYLDALQRVDTAVRDGDELVLSGGDLSLRFAPVPDWPASAVLDHTWRLHALTDDREGSTRVPAGDQDGRSDPAVLYLSGSRITATTGCRSLRGSWQEDHGVLVLTDATYRGDCGPEPSAQELQVTGVLERFTADVGFREGHHELVLSAAVAQADGTRQQLVYRR